MGMVHSTIGSGGGFEVVLLMCNTALCMERGLYCMIPLPEFRLVCIQSLCFAKKIKDVIPYLFCCICGLINRF